MSLCDKKKCKTFYSNVRTSIWKVVGTNIRGSITISKWRGTKYCSVWKETQLKKEVSLILWHWLHGGMKPQRFTEGSLKVFFFVASEKKHLRMEVSPWLFGSVHQKTMMSRRNAYTLKIVFAVSEKHQKGMIHCIAQNLSQKFSFLKLFFLQTMLRMNNKLRAPVFIRFLKVAHQLLKTQTQC